MLMERAKLRIIPEEGEGAVDPNHTNAPCRAVNGINRKCKHETSCDVKANARKEHQLNHVFFPTQIKLSVCDMQIWR